MKASSLDTRQAKIVSSAYKMTANKKESNPSLWQFVKAFCSQFRRVYSGGAVQVMIALIIVAFALQLPYYVHLWLLVLYGFVACFETWRDERKHADVLESEITKNRPKLIGFFQDLKAWEIRESESEQKPVQNDFGKLSIKRVIQEAGKVTGMRFVIKVGFVNDSLIPTTIHNFSLTVETSEGKTFGASYAEETTKAIAKIKNDGYIFPDSMLEKGINLDTYLDDRSKVAENGKEIEGFLVFIVKDFTLQEWTDETIITLSVIDAWGASHPIVNWGAPPRPSQRLSS